MRNFKMVLQYEGTRYQGWQRQESMEHTIQGRLDTLLTKMTGQKIEVQGSGRTDAGVHALGQVANFHADTGMSADEIMEYMNAYLPEDIGVVSLKEVPERFHSRLNAKGKTYCYRVLNTHIPHVFDRRYTYMVPEKLDLMAMRRAAEYLIGTHDFKAFTSAKKGKKSTVRTIESIRIERASGMSAQALGMPAQAAEIQDEIQFWYSGNGFLYHMVRIMTGTLLEVGAHKRRPEEMAEVLASGCREQAGALAPARGLTLMEVRY